MYQVTAGGGRQRLRRRRLPPGGFLPFVTPDAGGLTRRDPATPQPEAESAAVPTGAASCPPCAGALRTVNNSRSTTTRTSSPAAAARSRVRTSPTCTAKAGRKMQTGQTSAPELLSLSTPGPTAHALLGTDHQRPRTDPRQAQRQLRRGAGPGWLACTTGPADSSTPCTPTSTACTRLSSPRQSTYNCPLPAGPCPNMYKFVGNDPGQPGSALNP